LRRKLGATAGLVGAVREKFELIRAARNVKASYQIPANRRLNIIIAPVDDESAAFLAEDMIGLKALLYAEDVKVELTYQPSGPTATAVSSSGTVYLPLEGVIDVDEECNRLRKQENELLGFIEKAQRKLANERFVEKAPEDVVERERERLTEMQEKMQRVREQLASLAVA